MSVKASGKVYTLGDDIGRSGRAVYDIDVLKKAIKSEKVPLLSSFENLTDPMNVIGHCELSVKDDGVYATCIFNESNNTLAYIKALEDPDNKPRLGFYATNCDISTDGTVNSMEIRSVSLNRSNLGGVPELVNCEEKFIDSVVHYVNHIKEYEEDAP